jgi:Trk K+ transport system NAD-binding subunit
MALSRGRWWARISVALRQNRAAIAICVAWLAAFTALFAIARRLPLEEAALVALTLRGIEGTWGRVYASFTQVVVFGAVASVVLANVTRRYRPEATCAELAAAARGHLVVIGYSNLGRRLRDMAVEVGAPVVVVESDRDLVEALIKEEEPLVLGSAAERVTLEAAGVRHAEVVVIAADDLETAAVACRLVRDANPRCKLVVRCPDDDVGQALAKAYSARALSTSRAATQLVAAYAQRAGTRRALVMGTNRIGARVGAALSAERIQTTVIPDTDDPEALERAGIRDVDLVVIADDDLGKNLVRVDRVRDMNETAHVICRVFHEEAGQILANKPFRCTLLSSSRLSADALAGEGLLRGVGISAPRRKKAAR